MHAELAVIYADIETDRGKHRYKCRDEYTYNESQYSRTLMRIFREQDNTYHDEEKYMHIQ